MPIKKEQKAEIVQELGEVIKKSNSAVFVNFHGLNVAESTKLRRELRAKEIGYTVAKKTLAKRAFEGAKIEGEVPELTGEFAFAYGLPAAPGTAQAGKDLIAPAREVFNFQKTHKENLEIVGGIFEGKFMNKEQMMGIALIPPVEVLYGQFVNLINSPIQRFVVALDQIAQSKETTN